MHDAGGDGPYSALRSDDFRLIEFHEDDSIRLYNLADDVGEKKNLAESMTGVASALRMELHQWRESVGAQMPTTNPDHDPVRASNVGQRKKAGSK